MGVNTQTVKDIVENELSGWQSTNAELLAEGNGDSSSAFRPRYITEIDIINDVDPNNPLVGNAILDALENLDDLHAMKTLVNRVLRWLQPGERSGTYGANIGDENFRTQIIVLESQGVLTEAQRDGLLAMASPKTIWESHGISGIAEGHIEEARNL